MRIAVASSTPASAASGIFETRGAAAKTITARIAAWVRAASRELAPVRTLTAVRAMAPVAGTPPNSGAAMLARPWPNSSRSGSCCWPTVMPSATEADSSDSRAASAATATAGASREPSAPGSRKASDGAGRPDGRSPIGFAASRPATCATTVAAITARMEKGTVGRHRAPASITAATASAKPTAVQFGCRTNSSTARQVTTRTRSPSGLGTPSAFGICCRPITQAMPSVKPSTTGAGTYRM